MNLMSRQRREACKECPFKRNSAQGYLGSATPIDYADDLNSDREIYCHMSSQPMIEKGRGRGYIQDNALHCFGAHVVRNNSCKVPRDRDAAKVQKKAGVNKKDFFEHSYAFFLYHSMIEIEIEIEIEDGNGEGEE